ncbi:extracellular tungstate binding protein [Histoplasma capsulatum var. duboisii H88]|uniref:Extracellular tungstate binding protein n=1 Tax=Ajellomyces capsulatus (strain H88) TaxID=544711 RepID=A0A8A1L492_AJEC8|nr:extracellular tungstate binding protein [Histoplasma capsulatum var. duboisii H88]
MMRSLVKTLALACLLQFATTGAHAADLEEVYDAGYHGNDTVALRIANGGAGQSGLIRELADAFIKFRVDHGAEPFRVAWVKSDTTESINNLQSGAADVAFTYSPVAEDLAIEEGIALRPSYYAWRDHFMLIGPRSNPAKLNKKDKILKMISDIYKAAERGTTEPPTRFLTRFDKSATNIKDSSLFIGIGQVPWATSAAKWYHQYIAYPIQALHAASMLEEYTITDRGTFLSVSQEVRDNIVIYKEGSDHADDPLLNPAHLLIGAQAQDLQLAKEFAKWVVGSRGQKVILAFKKGGKQLYTGAP